MIGGAILAIGKAWGRVPAWAKWAALGIAILALLMWAIKLHGDARYREGVATEKAAWEAAERKLHEKAQSAGQEADEAHHERAADYAAEVAEERSKVDDAIENGQSPFDSMFDRNAGGVR